jgi:nickel-dependent lactate racemase
LLGVFGPKRIGRKGLTDFELAEKTDSPIGCAPIDRVAKGSRNVLIVTDDNTRQTPLHRILPLMLSRIEAAGVPQKRITILIGLGTHRQMTRQEIVDKFGDSVARNYRIINHTWNDPGELVNLGKCELGFEVVINKAVTDSDLILSVGSIIPHATVGYSGGGKTIMPGICGEKTIEDTHWAALEYEMRQILGNPSNRIREAIISISRKIGLHMVVNTILFNGDSVYDLVAGDVDLAHGKGIEKCKEIYGVSVPKKADIVVAEAYPTDMDLRQAIKAICSADVVCEDGGVLILPAECPEGIAPQFQEFIKHGFRDPGGLYEAVESGRFNQKILAYTLVAIGRIISGRLKCILVSPNISEAEAKQLGFLWARDLSVAMTLARKITGPQATVMVLKHAGEILPIL